VILEKNPEAWIAQTRFTLSRTNLLYKTESDRNPNSTDRTDCVGFLATNEESDKEKPSQKSHVDTSLEEVSNIKRSHVNLKDNDTSMNMASVVKISKAKEKRTLDLVEATRTILKEATSRFKTSNMMYN